MRLPILVLHISAGIVGLLSGAAALSFRKGSRRHGLAGSVFVISMVTLSAAGGYLAFRNSEIDNVLGSALAIYLVATAWVTARRREGETGVFDWVGLLVALAVGAGFVTYGLQEANSQQGPNDGPGGSFIFGFVAFLSAAGDVRMIVRGGVFGAHRIGRHLWRMCFALFVASASLFLARPQLFPALLNKTHVIFLLGILPLILMVFWLVRVWFTNAYKRTGNAVKMLQKLNAP